MNKLQRVIRDLLDRGEVKSDRTGVGTRSIFGYRQEWDLEEGHPHENTKDTPFKMNVVELLWIISGQTRLKPLKDHGIRIWDEWVIPGTEVWGEPYDPVQRGKVWMAMLERRVVTPEAHEQYVDIWMQENTGRVMDMAEVLRMWDHFNVPKAALLDGELGPVYGQQWRNIVDTRLIDDESEIPAYEKRGFKVIGHFEGLNDYTATKTVIERKIDQLQNVIDQLVNKPDDRGIIISAWHVPDLDAMALRPCHTLFQFYTRHRPWDDVLTEIIDSDFMEEWEDAVKDLRKAAPDDSTWTGPYGGAYRHPDYFKVCYDFAQNRGLATRYLDCQLYMRSNDAFLGRPFNITQYALLTRMIAQVVNMHPGKFSLVNGDLHLYNNHVEQANELLNRDGYPLPWVKINPEVDNIFDFKVEDFELQNYVSGGPIKAPVAV